MRDLINEFRKKKLKLKPITYLSGSYTHPFDVPHGYIWSPHLVPKPKGRCVFIVCSHIVVLAFPLLIYHYSCMQLLLQYVGLMHTATVPHNHYHLSSASLSFPVFSLSFWPGFSWTLVVFWRMLWQSNCVLLDLQTGDLRLMSLDFVSLTLLQIMYHQNR